MATKSTKKPNGERKARVTTSTTDALETVLALQKVSNWSDSQTGKLLGYSIGALGAWRKVGKAPYTAGLAAETLMRRNRGDGAVLIARVPRNVDEITTALQVMGCTVTRLE